MENKPLSGWLIASDIDGTLNTKVRTLPKRNEEAIRKYVYDYGGHFMLASGRTIESMRAHFEKLHLNSGLAAFGNGAGIYDYQQEKILWVQYIDETYTSQIISAAKKFPHAKLQIITTDECRLVRPDVAAQLLADCSKLRQVKYRKVDDVPTGGWCKVIFTGLPHVIDKVDRYVTDCNNGDRSNLMRSSVASFEVVSKGTNKGVAVMKVAQYLGIDKDHTAAIGDYFDDYEMLKTVGLPACCGQAPRGMKEIAKLVTCHCNRGAVADLIEYIIAHNANQI